MKRSHPIQPLPDLQPLRQDPATQPEVQQLAGLCKALGHPARVAIVRYLLKQNRCICGDIVNILPLAQSTVSQHLKILKAAGLVVGEVDGPRSCYCLDRDLLETFKNMVTKL